MAAFCLIKSEITKFKQALKDGTLDPATLSKMDSTERRTLFSKVISEQNAKQVNALFESKLLLKNQKAGFISWAKQVAGMKPKTKMDMLSRIERMENVLNPKEGEAFKEDLAAEKLRIKVTKEEAKNIADLSKKEQDLRAKANADGVFDNESDRLAYGMSKVELEKYFNDLKLQSQKIFFKEQPLRKVASVIGEIPGAMKSAVASLDNSLWGRQGIKTLLDVRTSKIWFKNFAKSWKDLYKQVLAKGKWYTSGDEVVMDMIKADIYSRPNALNGKYDAGGYGLGVLSEEAFPSSIPERIPLLGRLFKASESAYNGGALRLRADLADRLIGVAEKQGINTLDSEQARGMGHLVSSMTGHGSMQLTPGQSKATNVLLFSIKFLKSNIDTITAHQFDSKATKFTKKEAAKNLVSMAASVAAITAIAGALDPDSVDRDPRSSNFGKIKIFGRWTDITGGMAPLVTLASRLVPSYHNGKWSLWQKSSMGKWTDLLGGQYGQTDAWDLVINGLFSNKLSPVAGILRDVWRGRTFDGEPPTLEGELKNVTIPLTIQSYEEIKEDRNATFTLGSLILEGLGLSGSSPSTKKDWSSSTGKTLLQFKEKVGKEKFEAANEDYNRAYADWFEKTSQSEEYKKLSDESREKLISGAKEAIQEKVLKEYGFKYKTAPKTTQDKKDEQAIKKLRP